MRKKDQRDRWQKVRAEPQSHLVTPGWPACFSELWVLHLLSISLISPMTCCSPGLVDDFHLEQNMGPEEGSQLCFYITLCMWLHWEIEGARLPVSIWQCYCRIKREMDRNVPEKYQASSLLNTRDLIVSWSLQALFSHISLEDNSLLSDREYFSPNLEIEMISIECHVINKSKHKCISSPSNRPRWIQVGKSLIS